MEFVARIKSSKQIFDLTDKELAKKEGIYNPKANYGLFVACVGYGDVIKGLDEFLEGKEVDKWYRLEINQENGFGKRLANLIKLIPLSRFKEEKFTPFPGLEITVDGIIGVVKTVGGGRVIVDFNHPLAGKDLIYEFRVNRIFTDDLEKLKAFMKTHFNLGDLKMELKDNKAKIEFNLPKEVGNSISKEIRNRIPIIKEVSFEKSSK